ncbi:MAG: hypothetical protein IJ721_04350 [Bacteroidales bacterium]|nr:hypothetical protein [Bacteroidales bacterium]
MKDKMEGPGRWSGWLACMALAVLWVLPVEACTSVIVSGKKRADGRAVMFKHRDSDCQECGVERFQGEKYSLIGLVNADWRTRPAAKVPAGTPEVWAGMNSAGFCIMNTATYDLKNDQVPAEMMDREGVLMYRALEVCASLQDFEYFLDTLSRPYGVEANFGVIDAQGGAAYYEVDNWHRVKFDVDEEPSGYRVVTNFTRTGREEDRKGVDRYEKACRILARTHVPVASWDHTFFIKRISRSGPPILRDITSAAVVFEDGTMWTCLGKPDRVPCLPYTL